jgi:murein DD-endopeptidase MepM/ murein hydrolase activator NlpD
MVKNEPLYAFIISYSSRSRSQIRRFCLQKKWLKISAGFLVIVLCSALYGFYGLTQQARHLRMERENERLRAETERQRWLLNELNHRVQAVEDTSRKLAEKSGVINNDDKTLPSAGGPAIAVGPSALAALEHKMSLLEQDLRAYELVLRKRGFTPSIWPVDGKLESGFGVRRNPFGGSSSEFHTGQDIEVPWGTSVLAGAKGKVAFVGWQHGYGQLVVLDHGGGLTTRYGHLSELDVKLGQEVGRGEFIGRVGSTGRSTGPHLHYEVRINDEPVDPMQYLSTSTKQ